MKLSKRLFIYPKTFGDFHTHTHRFYTQHNFTIPITTAHVPHEVIDKFLEKAKTQWTVIGERDNTVKREYLIVVEDHHKINSNKIGDGK